MPIFRFVVQFRQSDPRSGGYLKDALALGFNDLRRIECQDLYFIEGQLSQDDLQQLALELLTNPVTQTAEYSIFETRPAAIENSNIVEVALRPGVTDPVAHEIVRAARELGFEGVHRAATGLRFLLEFDPPAADTRLSASPSALAEKLARQLLANNVIQHWAIGEITPSFPEEAASVGSVEILPVRQITDNQLLDLSTDRRAALDLAEMQAIQAYFRAEGRDPTDIEFETLAQTWSEHCTHKTFKARVAISNSAIGNYQSQTTNYPPEVNSIIKTYLKSATDTIAVPWVRSAFVDNAGIIDFDDEFEISFKVETHNHPSAIEPFGGANTGVGGVIRDVLGVSAKPIAATDVLCFGPQDLDPNSLPEGVLHPRRIQSGVVAGIQDYGNKIGVPTVNGAILYDEGFTANPLVFCGCVGIAPKGKHHKNPQPGDRVIVLGGRTGRDGLRGATFSSMMMDAQTGEVSGASVQIGDPITEKGLIDVITRARDLGLYHDITDCGAGGLSSAAGEMASKIGADIELQRVRLKYPGLAPWEIWLSEAQERMVLAVPPGNIPALQELCDTFDTELTDIGRFTGFGRLVVRYGGEVVLDLQNEFLHEGIPQRQLKAIIANSRNDTRNSNIESSNIAVRNTLITILSSPNTASKAATIRLYDHEVQGGTAVKPLVGIAADAPSDAAALKPVGTKGVRGIVLSNGINPGYGKRDAYKMAWAVVDEAIRNAVAVGADPERIALLDNFCWGDPKRPETMGTLVEAARGCHDAAVHFRTPFISGKDSLNNEYLGADGQRHAIPPTLLISAIGIIEDVNQAVTMDLKAAGNLVYLVGSQLPLANYQSVPDVPPTAPATYRALHNAIRSGLVESCHDLSEGGLAVAAAEMCIGGRLGMEIGLGVVATSVAGIAGETAEAATTALFAETNGCLLAEVAPDAAVEFEKRFTGLPLTKIGLVTTEPVLKIAGAEIPIAEIIMAFTGNIR